MSVMVIGRRVNGSSLNNNKQHYNALPRCW